MNGAPFEHPPGGGASSGIVDDAGATAMGPGLAAAARALWARRALVAACAGAGAVLMFAISLVVPAQFVADVSLLEAPRPGDGSALEQLGLSAQMLGIKAGPTANALTYPDILRSRRLLEQLLASRFALKDGRAVQLEGYLVRGTPSPQRTERAMETLRKRFDIALDRRTNLLRLSVRDHDPVLAAAVANAASAALQDVVMRAMTTQAGANRRFVETRLAQSRVELARAEDAAERFREMNRHADGSPRLLMEQSRLLRELRTREEVVVAMTREYEMARVDESRNVPVINVLDRAQVPAFRSSPRRGAMTAAGLLLGLAVGCALAWPRRVDDLAAEAQAEAA
jgi:uncharacterized protein involved in exopolysaccharide biosynthesis